MDSPDDLDPFVRVWEGPFVEADRVRRRIEAAHIPVDLGDTLEVGRAAVEVPASYVQEARDVLAGGAASWPEFTEDTLDGTDWKPGVRDFIRTLAIYVLVLMVLAALVAVMVF